MKLLITERQSNLIIDSILDKSNVDTFEHYIDMMVKYPVEFLNKLRTDKVYLLAYLAEYSKDEVKNQRLLMRARLLFALSKNPITINLSYEGQNDISHQVNNIQEYDSLMIKVKEERAQGKKVTILQNPILNPSIPGAKELSTIIEGTIIGAKGF